MPGSSTGYSFRSFSLKPGARRATYLGRTRPTLFKESHGASDPCCSAPTTKDGRRRCYGFISLIGSIILWCLHAEALADVELPQPKPTLLMYLLCINELLWVPSYPLCSCFDFTDELEDPPPPNMGCWVWYKRRCRAFWYRMREYFTWQFFFVFCMSGFFSETLWVWSLHGTTPPVNNTVYQMGIVFTAILCAMFLRGEHLTWCRCFWILVSIGGVCLVSFQVMDDEDEQEGIGVITWWGIALCLITALIGAVEDVYSKHLDKVTNYASLASDENSDDEEERGPWEAFKDSMVFSTAYSVMMGLSCWIFVVFFHFTGVEEFEFPGTEEWVFMLVYSASSDVYECLECWGLFVAGPMMMSTGSVLVIPLSYGVGILRETVELNGSSYLLILGTIMCIVGVVFVEWNPWEEWCCVENSYKKPDDNDNGSVTTVGVYKVVCKGGIAYRKKRKLRDRVLDRAGPSEGASIHVTEIRNGWVRCKKTRYWLPILILDETVLELIPDKGKTLDPKSNYQEGASAPEAGAGNITQAATGLTVRLATAATEGDMDEPESGKSQEPIHKKQQPSQESDRFPAHKNNNPRDALL